MKLSRCNIRLLLRNVRQAPDRRGGFMKKVLSWTGGLLLALVLLGGVAHASTSVEAHENGDCVSCNLFSCLHSMLYEALHHV